MLWVILFHHGSLFDSRPFSYSISQLSTTA
jgi:hypothetical protein